jgi:GMP synthase-like glutamine amidotransferase
MKPVVIFRHARTEGAGYLGTFLEQNAIPWCEVRIDLDDKMPEAVDDFSGLVFMGGPMSVNDDLPWISQALFLIQEAVARDIPVLGHCLGGQLMSKALGGTVGANPVKEIGWGNVAVTNHTEAAKWLGDTKAFLSFHWHGETFTLPAGATHLLSSQYCQNQAWSFGKHLALQCHIEMTENMVGIWYDIGKNEVAAAKECQGVQTFDEVKDVTAENISHLNLIANRVYSTWISGLK